MRRYRFAVRGDVRVSSEFGASSAINTTKAAPAMHRRAQDSGRSGGMGAEGREREACDGRGEREGGMGAEGGERETCDGRPSMGMGSLTKRGNDGGHPRNLEDSFVWAFIFGSTHGATSKIFYDLSAEKSKT